MRNRNIKLPEIFDPSDSLFIRSETIFENDNILVAKAYYYHKSIKPLGYYYDIDLGLKDEDGDINSFQTIVSRQRVQEE